MYKIGDKVETPLGVGQIYNISDKEYSDFTVELFGYEKHIVTLCNVNVKGQSLLYKDTDLKPYRTAHDKLIEMGLRLKVTKNYADGVFSHEWWNENDDRVIVFYIDEKVTTVYEGNNEIMNVIPQYLEELEEKKK